MSKNTSSKKTKWIDASAHDVNIVPVQIPNTNKVMLAIYGNITSGQAKKLAQLNLRDLSHLFPKINSNIEFFGVPWKKRSGKAYVTSEFLNELLEVFPKAELKPMTMQERLEHWKGMLFAQNYEGIYSVSQNPKVQHYLTEKRPIGKNLKGQQVCNSPSGARFIEQVNGDIILRPTTERPSRAFLYYNLKDESQIREVGYLLANEYASRNNLTAQTIESYIDASFNPPNQGTKQYGALFSNVVGALKTELIGRIRDHNCDIPIEYQQYTYDNEALFRIPVTPTKKIRGMEQFSKEDNMHLSMMVRGFIGFVEQTAEVKNIELIGEDSTSLNAYIPTSVSSTLIVDNPRINSKLSMFGTNELNVVQRDLNKSISSKSSILVSASIDDSKESEIETINGVTLSRADHKLALRTLMSSENDAHTMLVMKGDETFGVVSNDSMPLHEHIFRNYDVLGMIEVDDDVVGLQNEQSSTRVYFTGGRRLAPLKESAPRSVSKIESLLDLFDYSNELNTNLSYAEVKTVSDEQAQLTNSVSELLAYYNQHHQETAKHEQGELLRRYQPMTSMSRTSESMIPIHMYETLKFVYEKMVKDVGNPDQFICKELGWTPERFTSCLDAGQIDAVTMAIWNARRGETMVLGDAAGLGKGRILATVLYWNIKQGSKPVFFTKDTKLYSDIVRDFRSIGVWDEIKAFPLSSTEIKDLENPDVPLWSQKEIVALNKEFGIADPKSKNVKPLSDDYNIIFASYPQVRSGYDKNHKSLVYGRNKVARRGDNDLNLYTIPTVDSLGSKARLIIEHMSKQALPTLVNDESHVGLGRSSQARVVEAISNHVVENKDGFLLRSSATAAKSAESAALMSDIIGKGRMSQRDALNTLNKGGLEAFSIAAAKNGTYLARDHDTGNRQIQNLVDSKHLNRNRKATDTFARILNKGAEFTNLQYNTYFKYNPAQTTNKDVGNVGFSSPLHNLGTDFNIALLADFVADSAINSLQTGRKPAISIEATKGQALKELFELLIEEWKQEDYAERKFSTPADLPKEFILDELPTFQDTLRRWLKKEQSVRVPVEYTDEDIEIWRRVKNKGPNDYPNETTYLKEVHWREYLDPTSPEFAELEQLNRETEREIEKMPFMPLSPIDYVKSSLKENGYTMAEISGRKYYLNVTEEGVVSLINGTARDNTQAVVDFQSDVADAIIYTKSGTTGISLHADNKLEEMYDITLRPRDMYAWSVFQDIADEEQSANRTDRKNQKFPPNLFRVLTGLPLSNYKHLQADRRRRVLSAIRTGSSKSVREFSGGSFINTFGSRQIQHFLLENEFYIEKLRLPRHLDSRLRTHNIIETSVENDHQSIINTVLGRLMYLDCAEQEDFFESFRMFYNTEYEKELAQGRDPINISTMYADYKVLRQEHIGGGITRPFYDNELDRPLLAEFCEIYHKPVKIDTLALEKSIQTSIASNEFVNADGRLVKFASSIRNSDFKDRYLRDRYTDLTDRMVRSKIPTFEEALDASLGSKTGMIGLINEGKSLDHLLSILPYLQVGGVYRSTQTLSNQYDVIVDVHVSDRIDARFPIAEQWNVSVANTRTNDIRKMSFRKFMFDYSSTDILKDAFDGTFSQQHEANDVFEINSSKGFVETRWLLTGNPLEAARLNALRNIKTIGAMTTMISSNGDVNLLLLASEKWRPSDLTNNRVKVSLQQQGLIEDVIQNNRVKEQIFEFFHTKYDPVDRPKEKLELITESNSPDIKIRLPSTKTPRNGFDLEYCVAFGLNPRESGKLKPNPYNHAITASENNKISKDTCILRIDRNEISKVFEALQSRGFHLSMLPQEVIDMQELLSEHAEVDLALSNLLSEESRTAQKARLAVEENLHIRPNQNKAKDDQIELEDAEYNEVDALEEVDLSAVFNDEQSTNPSDQNQLDDAKSESNFDIPTIEGTVVNTVGSVVSIGVGTFKIEEIDEDKGMISVINVDDESERFTMTDEELEIEGIAVKGITDDVVSARDTLVEMLSSLDLGQVQPTWLDENGHPTVDLFDDVFDKLCELNFDINEARVTASEMKNKISSGEYSLEDFGFNVGHSSAVNEDIEIKSQEFSAPEQTLGSDSIIDDSTDAEEFNMGDFTAPDSIISENEVANVMTNDHEDSMEFNMNSFDPNDHVTPEPASVVDLEDDIEDFQMNDSSFNAPESTANAPSNNFNNVDDDSLDISFEGSFNAPEQIGNSQDPLGSVLDQVSEDEDEDLEDEVSFNFTP